MARAGFWCGGPSCGNRTITPSPHLKGDECHPLTNSKGRDDMTMVEVSRKAAVTGGSTPIWT